MITGLEAEVEGIKYVIVIYVEKKCQIFSE
jgi:hypothetical protein